MSTDGGPEDGPESDSDGRIRCEWAGAGLLREYHDTEWGRPLRGTTAMFERLVLESFQSGLSWLIILRKRENFRRAFAGFDVETVAAFTDRDVERLMGDAGIVRNRAKIEATIANARVAADLDVELSDLLWSFAPPPRPRPAGMADLPSHSSHSAALARELRRRGFRFVGPTTTYSLMQATGMVDDHIEACWVPLTGGPGAVTGL
ncbi:MAG TPA: DNA-3-methyladenine glycosylase I [Mycobacterium sp.]|nr:DNA-3-methyladenine glycosylase I [Mycobacterium sp.]HQE16344.1 DNA-3-methyladenine glycosylase I [Mycobacterium sp.]